MRGYGLVDSPRVSATRGQTLDLEAVMAPDPRAAAQIYPASYWLSLVDIPEGEHSSERIVREVKDCLTCHAIGDKATREFPPNLGSFDSTLDAWDRRVRDGGHSVRQDPQTASVVVSCRVGNYEREAGRQCPDHATPAGPAQLSDRVVVVAQVSPGDGTA